MAENLVIVFEMVENMVIKVGVNQVIVVENENLIIVVGAVENLVVVGGVLFRKALRTER